MLYALSTPPLSPVCALDAVYASPSRAVLAERSGASDDRMIARDLSLDQTPYRWGVGVGENGIGAGDGEDEGAMGGEVRWEAQGWEWKKTWSQGMGLGT